MLVVALERDGPNPERVEHIAGWNIGMANDAQDTSAST